ncbi:MAG: TonB-dependent receptor [Chromatiales bacterium]|nr:TonB-dependent receptor [Chromatiales bacterium]
MNKLQLTFSLLLIGTSTSLQAIDTIDPVIVTATRTAQSADETLASVTVITREEIEQSQAGSLMELLHGRAASLDFSRNGGPGSNTSLFLRGSESDHVLVLIDGVRAASVTNGAYNWASLNPAQIERIEIVRGPHSTLYGSEAIGGVIQIFTRRGKGLHASLSGGSYGTAGATFGTGGELGEGRYHLNLSHKQSEGFSTTNASSTNYESDDDGYKNSSVGIGYSTPIGNDLEFGINLSHTKGRNDYDDGGYANAYAETQNNTAEMHIDWQTSENWNQRLSVNSSEDLNESHDSWPATITTRRKGINWQHDLETGHNSLLTLGLDAQQDHGKIADSYDEKTTTQAGYLQYQWSGKQLDLLLGARSDQHSEYDQHTTGRLVVGSRLGEGRLYASYATAFKAPTFNELYYPFYGDPTLLPEESVSVEVGYRRGQLRASLFKTEIDNLIQYNTLTWLADNIGQARITGAELEYGLQVSSWRVDSSVTLQKAEDVESGENLLRRAEKKIALTASGPVTAATDMGIEISYTGRREDSFGFPSQRVFLPSFTLLNLTGEYRISPNWRLKGRVENLLNDEYQLAYGYNTPGASAYISLHYTQ